MSRKLTEEETLRLVQLYRQHECLWDIRSEAYKNKQMRMSALKQICEAMDIKGLNIDEIKTKIKIIRSTYYLELNKIEKSTRSGAEKVYVPRVKWFNELNSFIKTVAARRTIPVLRIYDIII
ncbi:unnamed protein product [Euphydryas editha]|uniref:MADF domain-containing protein n=1 Tax=Euphydryas editha TaxID=104508 RepID=A0AAU9UF21_EUPED|nr:unnamed protein product [Euphydryas editha]